MITYKVMFFTKPSAKGKAFDLCFTKDVESDHLHTVTQSFLKRLGNKELPKPLERQRQLIKELTKSSQSIIDWETNINQKTDFNLIIETFRGIL